MNNGKNYGEVEETIIKSFKTILLNEAIRDYVLDKISIEEFLKLPDTDERVEKFNEYVRKTSRNYLLDDVKNSYNTNQIYRLVTTANTARNNDIKEKYNALFKLLASKLGFEDIDYEKYLSLSDDDERKIAITNNIQKYINENEYSDDIKNAIKDLKQVNLFFDFDDVMKNFLNYGNVVYNGIEVKKYDSPKRVRTSEGGSPSTSTSGSDTKENSSGSNSAINADGRKNNSSNANINSGTGAEASQTQGEDKKERKSYKILRDLGIGSILVGSTIFALNAFIPGGIGLTLAATIASGAMIAIPAVAGITIGGYMGLSVGIKKIKEGFPKFKSKIKEGIPKIKSKAKSVWDQISILYKGDDNKKRQVRDQDQPKVDFGGEFASKEDPDKVDFSGEFASEQDKPTGEEIAEKQPGKVETGSGSYKTTPKTQPVVYTKNPATTLAIRQQILELKKWQLEIRKANKKMQDIRSQSSNQEYLDNQEYKNQNEYKMHAMAEMKRIRAKIDELKSQPENSKKMPRVGDKVEINLPNGSSASFYLSDPGQLSDVEKILNEGHNEGHISK